MADQDISISADTTPATGKSALRKRLFLIFGIAIALVALLVLAWQWLFAWRTVSTDNAYVGADVAQVTPRVAGTATEVLEREHGVRSGVYYTQHVPLPGAPEMAFPEFLRAFVSRAAPLGLDSVAATHLARSYGTDAIGILRDIERDPALGGAIVAGQPYRWAEVPHAVRGEMALTLEDVLRRRIHLFQDAEDGGMEVARAVAERMAGEEGIGWGEAEVSAEVARYAEAVERTRIAAPPSR